MKLVDEDEFGAYSGVRPEFLKKFICQENNPNFEVYDSLDRNNRFIAAKSSRIPDDEDFADGRFGIDFNRAKPTLIEALQYGAELPRGYKWLGDIAFATVSQEEYDIKSTVWDSFYSYIWNTAPQTVWVAPHSGDVNRAPDDIIVFPKLLIDHYSAGVAALCAFNDRTPALKRVMMTIHGTGQLAAVLNLGDYGILDVDKMDVVAKNIEQKYHSRVQTLADEFKRDYYEKTLGILESISRIRGTLDPEKLKHISDDDSFKVRICARCLKLYGQEIKEFTLAGMKEALSNLGKIEVPVILNNYIYPARNAGKILKLSAKIRQGLMSTALNIECSRLYLKRAPELVVNIILDVKKELFG